jgi:hypothetical protein
MQSVSLIGWFFMPIGVLIALWVLLTRVDLESMRSYAVLSMAWTWLLGFGSTHEGADQATAGCGQLGEAVGGGGAITALARSQVLHLVHTCDLHANVGEASFGQQLTIGGLFQRTGDAACPQLHALAQLGGQSTLNDDV